jgi:hypothetical protein
MVVVDKSALKKEYREAVVDPMLLGFADLVSFAKPCCNYVVDDSCVDREYTNEGESQHHLRRFKVFENGEELGDICVGRRYSRGSSEMVYKVRSFRINKERGDRNGVMAKDLKVALRHAKKVLISRESSELIKQVKTQISNFVDYHHQNSHHRLQWTMNSSELAVANAMLAYEARLKGEETVVISSKVVTQNAKDHDEHCELYKESKALYDAMKANRGYGVFRRIDDSLIVYSFATDTVKRYAGFDELPLNIQSKYAMFKVLAQDEAHATLGCKFGDDYTYVVE